MRKKAIDIARNQMLAFACIVSISLTIGCAGDGGRNPVSDLFSTQPDSLAQVRNDIQQFQPLAKSQIVNDAVTANATPWFTSYEKARQEAENTGKLILADFTGSDWYGL
jgi:hypothetical protein